MLDQYERHVYSQAGEDGVIEEIFHRIGEKYRTAVEIASGPDGRECNTRFLKEKGWKVWQFDQAATGTEVIKAKVTPENAAELLHAQQVSAAIDLLSIDIDGNDYWLLRELVASKSVSDCPRLRPRVIVCEYNSYWPPVCSLSVPLDPAREWDGTTFFGASLGAFTKLLHWHYALVHCGTNGVNAFFVRRQPDSCQFQEHTAVEAYRPIVRRRGAHPFTTRLAELVEV